MFGIAKNVKSVIQRNIPMLSIVVPGVRRSVSSFNQAPTYRLEFLEEIANRYPADATKQYQLIKELNKLGQYQAVVERIRHGAFASSSDIQREYMIALHELAYPAQQQNYTANQNYTQQPPLYSTTSYAPPQNMAIFPPQSMPFAQRGTSTSPLHVLNTTLNPQAPVSPDSQKKAGQILPLLALAGLVSLFFYFYQPGAKNTKKIFSILSEDVTPVKNTNKKFSDVIGCDEAKDELEEIVEYLKDREKFTRLGGKLPKGVLLVGPPGTGKTLLAKAIAGEAGVPFFYNSGSEFEEMFVGVGARRIKNLFEAARKNAPCIIFIDEIDAVGAKRNPKDQSYMRMTLNQLLSEMDGFNSRDGVIVIGATNFPESLDKALVRPGRFDRTVNVAPPDVKGRTQILDFYLKNIPKAKDVSTNTIARGTPGFCGADLENIVNIAAVKAAMDNKVHVTNEDLEYAKDRVMMGAERKSHVMTDEARKLTAYHEGGHALVALYTSGAHPIHKATIMPRGQALGMVMQLPEKDLDNYTYEQLLAMLDVCMGGRVAEELIFGKDQVTTGAGSDFKQATRIATQMVTRYGMSEVLGPLVYEENVHEHGQMYSSETRRNIESEVRKLVDNAYQRAMNVLIQHKSELHFLARTLLETETLSGQEIKQLLTQNKDAIKKIETEEDPVSKALVKKGSSSNNNPIPAVAMFEEKKRK